MDLDSTKLVDVERRVFSSNVLKFCKDKDLFSVKPDRIVRICSACIVFITENYNAEKETAAMNRTSESQSSSDSAQENMDIDDSTCSSKGKIVISLSK
jgi:hypothetical protein